MLPTAEEKERFLQYIRDGDDRATAAWRINPELTGTSFRRICAPASKNYDPEFASAYDEAVEERGPLDPDRPQVWSGARDTSSSMTANGLTKAMHLTHDQLERFLEQVRDGVMPFTAARELEPPTSMTQIQRRVKRDPEFAAAFREAQEEGISSYKDELRAEAKRQAFAGDYRALKDQMLMHLEEAGVLQTSRHEVTGLDGAAIRLLAERHFSDLPPEMLDEMIATLERKEKGQSQIGQGGG